MKEFLDDILLPLAIGCAFVAVVVLGGTGICISISNRATFRQDVARIEQLRVDSAGIDPSQSEDVIGKVVDVNLSLARKRVCNTQWWCDWMVPDGWDAVPMLPVPGLRVAR